MSTYSQIDPETFIKSGQQLPPHGRGAWTKTGIEFSYRYELAPNSSLTIGTRAEASLDHWAVAAGAGAIQMRLADLGRMDPLGKRRRGIFDQKTVDGVKEFQKVNIDPESGDPLVVDGTVGRSDARALFTPVIDVAEKRYGIPDRYLLGETNHESRLDPGALGYYIYYPDYRGVDRSVSQINSKYNASVTWEMAFNPMFALEWSAKRLRDYYDMFKHDNPKQNIQVWWDAAICAHNNPSAASDWAQTGSPPTTQAAAYVSNVKAARY